VALRYFNVYGPGEEHKGEMASFLYQANLRHEVGEKVRLFPGGPTRDFVYIKDITSANLYALENFSELSGHFYDVATAESRSFEDVLALAGIGFSYTDEAKIPNGYQFYTRGDPKKWMPGWRPKYPLERGVDEYLKYLRQDFVTESL
jgi:ADP-L-glycero-D-manno-heptose 6-epimerase